MRPSSLPRLPVLAAVAAVVLAVVLAVVVAGLLYARHGDTGVRAGVRAYEVLSDRAVRVQVEVSQPPGQVAVCTLRARDATGLEVGTALVRVGPSPQRTVVVEREVPTSARAVTGEVAGCADDPSARPTGSATPRP